jgi:predicted DNA-binding transcriptional regulator AlpA
MNNIKEVEAYMTIQEVMKMLNYKSRKTIYGMIKQGMPVHYPVGTPRFLWSEIQEWVKNREANK